MHIKHDNKIILKIETNVSQINEMRFNSFHFNLAPQTFLQNYYTLIVKEGRYSGPYIFNLHFDLSKQRS